MTNLINAKNNNNYTEFFYRFEIEKYLSDITRNLHHRIIN